MDEKSYIRIIEGQKSIIEFLKDQNEKQAKYIDNLFSLSTIKSLYKKRRRDYRKAASKLKQIEKEMEEIIGKK
jgi:hypothetical protein